MRPPTAPMREHPEDPCLAPESAMSSSSSSVFGAICYDTMLWWQTSVCPLFNLLCALSCGKVGICSLLNGCERITASRVSKTGLCYMRASIACGTRKHITATSYRVNIMNSASFGDRTCGYPYGNVTGCLQYLTVVLNQISGGDE